MVWQSVKGKEALSKLGLLRENPRSNEKRITELICHLHVRIHVQVFGNLWDFLSLIGNSGVAIVCFPSSTNPPKPRFLPKKSPIVIA